MTDPRWLREHEEKMAKATPPTSEWKRCEDYAAINVDAYPDKSEPMIGAVVVDCNVGGLKDDEQEANADAVWSAVNLDPVFVAAARCQEKHLQIRAIAKGNDPNRFALVEKAAKELEELDAAYDAAKHAAGLEDE